KITNSKIADFYRRKQVEVAASGGSDAVTLAQQLPFTELPDPDSQEESAEATILYHRAVALIQSEFEEKTWAAFRALVMEGQTPAEVAEALHMSVGAVYTARSRVRKRLHEEFKDLLET